MLAFVSFMLSSFWIGLGVKDVDLVWGTSPPIFQGVTAWALARLKRAKFLFEVRDLWPQFAIAVGVLKNPLLIRLSEWLERFLYRAADRVMVNSPGYRGTCAEFAAAGRCGSSPTAWTRPCSIPPAGAKPTARRTASRTSSSSCTRARHGMSNDLGVILEAARLLQDLPHVRIALLGDGKEKPALMEQAEAMGLSNVSFLTPVSKAGMPEALAAADACVAILKPLDEYKTTYPNKVFDYMAAGRPVALAIDGVIRAVVEAAGCGYFAAARRPRRACCRASAGWPWTRRKAPAWALPAAAIWS